MDNDKKFENRLLKKLRNRMIVTYTIIAVIAIIAISVFLIQEYSLSQKQQAETFASSMSVQIKKNINSYLHFIKNSSMIIFENEDFINYSPENAQSKTKQELDIEEQISDKMNGIAITQNLSDFGIIYKNGDISGKISNGTKELFGEKIFTELYSLINTNENGTWLTSYENNYNRVYYIQKINANAIMLTSFYSTEFDKVFVKDSLITELYIYLVDNDGNVLYASENTEKSTGDTLENESLELFQNNINKSFINDKYIGAITSCDDSINIICFFHTDKVLADNADKTTWLLSVILGVTVLCICAGFVFAGKYTNDYEGIIKKYKKNNDIDEVTGLYNSMGIDEQISERIETSLMGSTYAFALIKIDDFDEIGSHLGTEFVNDTLNELAKQITCAFKTTDILGINEKHEFIIFADFSDFDLFKAHNMLKDRCNSVCNSFKNFCVGDDKSVKINISMGVCVYPDNGKCFDELYENAKTALDISTKSDQSICIFYDTLRNK